MMNQIVTRDQVHAMLSTILEQTGFTLEQLQAILVLLSKLYPKEWTPPEL